MATIPLESMEEESSAPETTQTVAVRKSQPPTVAQEAPLTANGFSGEITASDIRLPRINLVQKTGKLVDDFKPGSFVFEKSVALAKPGKDDSIKATVLRFKKYYQEKLAFGESDEFPKRADTVEEVRALGGQVAAYGVPNYYQEVADIMFAVEGPDDLDEEASQFFPYELNGKVYAVALYTVASSGFTSLAKRLITDAAGALRTGAYKGKYEVHSELRSGAKGSWFVPVGVLVGLHSDEDSEFFKRLAGF